MRPFDAEANWQALAGSYPRGWSGWRGDWAVCDSTGDRKRAWPGARMFHNNGDGTYEQVNVYSRVPDDFTGRTCDDAQRGRWSFSKAEACRADGWWLPYLKEDGLLRSRVLGISPSRTATVCFALPLQEFLEQEGVPTPSWEMELFVRPADPRSDRCYSCSAAYSTSDGAFQRLFNILEARSTEGPATAPTWDNLPVNNSSRWGLENDLDVWSGVPGCTTNHNWENLTGVTQQLVFDDDGSIAISAEEAASWTPPCSSLRMTALRDTMYMAYPEALPTTLAGMPAKGVTFEFGGVRPMVPWHLCGWGTGFSRTVLHYGPSGRISSIRFDDFDLKGIWDH